MSESLLESFLPLLQGSPAPEVDKAQLEKTLTEAIRMAEETWSEFSVPPADFVAHLAGCLGESEDPVGDLGKVHVSDVFLAFACARGDQAAVGAFRDHVRASVQGAIRKMGGKGTLVADIEQDVWERLLVPRPDAPPRIAQYAGRARLRAWVGVVAARQATQFLRQDARQTPSEDWVFDAWAVRVDEEENQRLKDLYRNTFKQAFERALASLTPRDRNILRMHLLDGMSVPQIGTLYRVNRTTALRWLTGIRDRLYKQSRKFLAEQTRSSRFEADSLMKLLRSQLEPSISRILTPPTPGPPKDDQDDRD